MNDEKILKQFKKMFFKNGGLCSKYNRIEKNFTLCHFYNYIALSCNFYNEKVINNARCDQCIEEQGL